MTYKEAYLESHDLLGKIKCTFCELYTLDGNKLFSVQKAMLTDADTFALVRANYSEAVVNENELITVSVNTKVAEWALAYASSAKTASARKSVAALFQYLKNSDFKCKIKPVACDWEPVVEEKSNLAWLGVAVAVASQILS